MANVPHPDLDLAGTIRPGLDILANEIVIALKKRTRFAQNLAIYSPGLVTSDSSISLLNYVLQRVEQCHAELGRYTFAAQDAFTSVENVTTVLNRTAPESPLLQMQSGAGDRIIKFYQGFIEQACDTGDNSDTYGQTVTADVDALLAIMERVNLGKSVAESKFQEMPEAFIATEGRRDEMLQYIVRKDREEQVIILAENLANHYELPAEHVIATFKFMIATTVDIEVDYLRQRIAGLEINS